MAYSEDDFMDDRVHGIKQHKIKCEWGVFLIRAEVVWYD